VQESECLQDVLEPAADGRQMASIPEGSVPAFSIPDILQHCRKGGTLEVEVLSEALQAQVQSIVDSELKDMTSLQPEGNGMQNSTMRAQGCQEKSKSPELRLKALLTLLASWHAVCLRAEKFVHAKHLCVTLMNAERYSKAPASRMIRTYVNTVQQVCRQMHGFILDIPWAVIDVYSLGSLVLDHALFMTGAFKTGLISPCDRCELKLPQWLSSAAAQLQTSA
jgi:hypothetical protein